MAYSFEIWHLYILCLLQFFFSRVYFYPELDASKTWWSTLLFCLFMCHYMLYFSIIYLNYTTRIEGKLTAGRTMVINVEYNQLDPLLRATGYADGDVNCETGYSPFPGNINQVYVFLNLFFFLHAYISNVCFIPHIIITLCRCLLSGLAYISWCFCYLKKIFSF